MKNIRILFGLWLTWPAWVTAQGVVADIPVAGRYGPVETALAVNTVTHRIFVADSTGIITVIDGPTQATTTLQLGGQPSAVAVNETTNKVYVADAPDNSITVIDGATNALTTVSDPNATGPANVAGPRVVAVNGATNKIYVGNANGNVTVIDGATNGITTVNGPTTTVNEPSWVRIRTALAGIVINPTTNQIYVANFHTIQQPFRPPVCDGGMVTVIDGTSNTAVNVNVGPCPAAIALNPVTNKIFVTLGSGVAMIDGITHAVTTLTDPSAKKSSAIAVNSATNKVYVTNTGSDNVTVIDGVTLSMTTLSAANALVPTAVAVDQTTNKIYVANVGAGAVCPAELMGECNPGSVTLIDGVTHATTLLIDPKANAPRALAVDPVTDRIYVANVGSSNVSVIGGEVIPTTHALAVIFTGASGGTATSHPAGIDCAPSTSTSAASTACAASFPVGTLVSLTAVPAAGTVLSDWSAPCAGTGSCEVAMNADQFVTATFQTLVPNVVGLSFGATNAALEGAGLILGTETQQQSNGVAPQTVLNENPAAGTATAPGTAVNLVVSAYSTVPDVTGQPSAAAVSALAAAGLAAGNVTSQRSSSVPLGTVISESPAAGSVVAPSSAVNLVVSSGGSSGGGGGSSGGGGAIGLAELSLMLCLGLGRALSIGCCRRVL